MAKPIIGFVIEDIGGVYESRLWTGVRERAIGAGLRVVCFPGGHLRGTQYNPFENQRNDIYRYLTRSGLQGAIIVGSIGNGVERERVAGWLKSVERLPLVGVTPPLGEYPVVETDDYAGMRGLMEHLVKEHGYRSPAFIQGPMDNVEARRRFQAYVDVLDEAGIPLEPSRVFAGDFSATAGETAARELIRNPRQVDVVVAVNDSTALAAMRVMQAAGVRIPDDIAVTGYDNLGSASCTSPGLTTVHQPFEAVGARAVDLLCSRLWGTPENGRPVLPRLVVRGSCGCTSPLPFTARPGSSVAGRPVVGDIAKAFGRLCADLGSARTNELLATFDHACQEAVETGDFTVALRACDALTRSALRAGSDIYLWRGVLTDLYTATIRSRWMEAGIIRLLFELAGVVENAARQLDMRVRHGVQSRHEVLHEVSRSLTATFALDELAVEVRRQLPRLGIERGALVLNPSVGHGDEGELELLTAFDTRTNLNGSQRRKTFCADRLLPGDMLESMLQSGSAVALPLHFRDETLGHMVVDEHHADGRICEALGALVASACRGVRLVEHVRHQRSELQRANRSLRTMRKKEGEYVRKIENDLTLARRIQESFLPHSLPDIRGWDFAASFRPVRGVAGDFYDVFELTSGRIVCVIADVCGKGVGAALFMSLVRSLIRSYLERCEGNGEELCAAAAHANDYIARHHNRDSSRTCMFATAFLLSLEASSGQCTYVNAGHVQPFLFGGGRQTGLLEPTGPGLGLAPAMRFRSAQTTIARGQSLFMYTDGVNEARDVHDELFGKERLRTILERMQVSGAGEVNERVDRALIEHRRTRPEEDDTTMLAVMRCAPSTVGVPQ